MRVKNVLISIIMLVFVGYGGVKVYMWQKAKQDIDKVFLGLNFGISQAYGYKVTADYKQISTSIFGPVGIKGVRIRIPAIEEEITVAEFNLLERDFDADFKNGGLPLRLHFKVTDLNMNTSLIDKIEEKVQQLKRQHNIKDDPKALFNRLGYAHIVKRSNDLVALGYKKLSMDFEIDMTLDAESKEATLKFHQDIDDVGKLDLTLKFANMGNNINNTILGLQIKEAKLEFKDDSYMNRLLKSYANESNMSLSAFRTKLIADIKQDFDDKKIKINASSVENIQAFVKKPEEIILTLYPFRPVGIGSLKHYKAGDVPSLLNFQVHVE